MENVNIVVLIGIVGTICSILFGYMGYQRGTKKEVADNSKNNGTLMSDIGYIKSGVDDLKRKQETGELRHYELCDRVTKTEESLKSAWHKISEMKEVAK